jgi:hypothetical protein
MSDDLSQTGALKYAYITHTTGWEGGALTSMVGVTYLQEGSAPETVLGHLRETFGSSVKLYPVDTPDDDIRAEIETQFALDHLSPFKDDKDGGHYQQEQAAPALIQMAA